MVKVVGIRFKKAGKIYYFDPAEILLDPGDYVIVETARGIEYGQVVLGPKEVSEEELVAPVKPVIRKATKEDRQIAKENDKKEEEALMICQQKIEKHGLEMKLIDVEYTFDNNKIIFYFSAEGRVDFRELVKDLASVFKTRIELRQIGVRDEAKMLGGLGPCGGGLCCATWLGDFEPVSIKMAKEQNLSLNPNKISGICGRLLCCLKFEQEAYEDAKERFPEEGDTVQTPSGIGEVIEVNLIREKVKVKFKGEDIVVQSFPYSEVTIMQSKKNSCCKKQILEEECDCKNHLDLNNKDWEEDSEPFFKNK
ncbi:PSP1 domain-containing protein [Garciella nitratireducens]|uniref:PSP1 domain-containing protein n=1 Tax=Garciella nitratireducens TaxID=218205 RepID=UPI000DEB5FAB|nr:stage 0 sporulation family protein [Garciella nitratireducens]RBP42215.1 cell fate regulator YaaT (PSP1 superfamily) [Garciella nitratireducens]